MTQVKPVKKEMFQGRYQYVPGCAKYFFIFLSYLLFWIGLRPMKVNEKTKTLDFELLSMSSFFAFVRLVIFTFPFLILPLIFNFSGLCKIEFEETTGKSFGESTFSGGLKELLVAEFCLDFLIFILPFAFAYVYVEHGSKMWQTQFEFEKLLVGECLPSFVNLRQVLFPILGFVLFAFGKLLSLTLILTETGLLRNGLYINVYTFACFFLLAHLPLHSFLAINENTLYQLFNSFHVLSCWTSEAKDQVTLLARAKMLPGIMKGIQRGFGFFILVDITLMLIYWLLHLYHTYFTFQVSIK